MSTLQVSNIHFESTGNNRLQFTGSNSYNLVGGGVTVATINSTAVGFPVSFAVNNVVANDSISVGAVLVANSTVVNATHLGGVISSLYQLNSTLPANVATLTANNTSFVGTVSAANVVSNAQLSSNLSNYQTSAGLSANVIKLASNSALYANASITNTFTIGSTGYFVANGNLGIGTNAPAAKVDLNGGYAQNIVTLGANGALSMNVASGSVFKAALNGTTTFSFTGSPPSKFTGVILELTNGGNYAVNWPANTVIKWPVGTAPTLTSSGTDVLGFMTFDGGTTWRGSIIALNSTGVA